MNKLMIILAFATTLLFNACTNLSNKTEPVNQNGNTQTFNLDTTKLNAGASFYQCEMDKEVISDMPGKCPKCGMDLTEIRKK